IEKELFELVLLAIMIPQVNGIELLEIIKERWPNLGVVMVTGYPSIETAVEATRLGAFDYLAKPFTPDELREKVDEALEETASAKVIPIQRGKGGTLTAFCPTGKMECDIYGKKGKSCKTKDGMCPKIKKAQLKAQNSPRMLAEEIGQSAIDIDLPFDYDEVAKYASPAYAKALDSSGMPLVNWEDLPEEAPAALPEILVIDDEVVVGNSVRKILKPRGYHVEHAETQGAAMEILSEKPVDMILLDMKIPGVHGLDLLKAIREEHPIVPVVMITGYASVETAVESIKLGAADYVSKPFTPDELHHAVEGSLKRAA
ncbi:MAG: response regulator, partial [Deltaproteobacteria bacterium]|nr:response regulator [Deltaproteobacteria bacterium]